jgi:hypothetical protein
MIAKAAFLFDDDEYLELLKLNLNAVEIHLRKENGW